MSQNYSQLTNQITQLFGDAATFDCSGHNGKADLEFVDGLRSYGHMLLDSATAMRLAAADSYVAASFGMP
jgi:hypothetical protein